MTNPQVINQGLENSSSPGLMNCACRRSDYLSGLHLIIFMVNKSILFLWLLINVKNNDKCSSQISRCPQITSAQSDQPPKKKSIHFIIMRTEESERILAKNTLVMTNTVNRLSDGCFMSVFMRLFFLFYIHFWKRTVSDISLNGHPYPNDASESAWCKIASHIWMRPRWYSDNR